MTPEQFEEFVKWVNTKISLEVQKLHMQPNVEEELEEIELEAKVRKALLEEIPNAEPHNK